MPVIENVQHGRGRVRTALITGATGRIGQDLSRRLAQEGYRLALVGRDGKKLQLLMTQLSSVESGPHVAVEADLMQPGSGAAASQRAIAEFGRVGLLVHLASPAIVDETALYDAKYSSSLMRIVCESFMEAACVLLPHMLPAQQGRLVGFLDEAINVPKGSSRPAYVMAKMALVGALMSLAQHCRDTGVSCVGIAPGALDDDGDNSFADESRKPRVRLDPKYFLDLVLDDLDGPSALENGNCHVIGTVSEYIVPMTGLRTNVTVESSVDASLGTASTAGATPRSTSSARAQQTAADSTVLATVSQSFRRVFGLPSDADVRGLGTHNLSNWDSLKQLKLLMEIEQALEIRIPSDRIESIATFEELYQAVMDAL